MTAMLLFSIAMAQSPSDGAESKSDSAASEASSEEGTEGVAKKAAGDAAEKSSEESENSEGESLAAPKIEAEKLKEAEKLTSTTPDVSLYSEFCPSGIKVPNLSNSAQQRELENQWLKNNLSRYTDQAEYILIGEIAGHRGLMANQGRDMMVDVIVYDWLRGKEGAVISIHVPYNTPFIPGCPETVPPTVVDGYTMLFFVDKQKMVIEGNALFFLEAGYGWRNKRPDVFLSPRTDRDWIANDPAIDYVMYELKAVRAAVEASNARRSFVAQADEENIDALYGGERWWHFWK